MIIALGILSGALPITWLKILPHSYTFFLWVIPCVMTFHFYPHKYVKNLMIYLVVAILMFGWTIYYCQHRMSWQLTKNLEDTPLLVEGTIASLVSKNRFGARFTLFTSKINNDVVHKNILVKWNNTRVNLSPGDKLQLVVKLKKPYGLMNPGSFDKEKWYFVNNIGATGLVLKNNLNKIIGRNKYTVNYMRQIISDKLMFSEYQNLGILRALIIGEKNQISDTQNTIFKNTGTSHLMAISGLHVGLVAGGFFYCSRYFLKLFPLCGLMLPSQVISCISAFIGALVYSLLAGFSFSTQRALVMTGCALLKYILPWKPTFVDALALALIIILITNPIAILDTGFWLSFYAVSLLGYAVVMQPSRNTLWNKWCRAQWVCTIGLIPITCWYFNQFSPLSFVANLIAIPWVSFIVVPLTFLSVIILFIHHGIAEKLLFSAHLSFDVLFKFLDYTNIPKLVVSTTIPSIFVLILSCVGVLIIFAPKGWVYRFVGVLFFIPLILHHPAIPQYGDAKITVLDVGQGLASVVQTQAHTLIFDTGPSMGKLRDTGKDIINPFLIHQQIKHIDKMVISHGDNDHMGGAISVLKKHQAGDILTSEPQKLKRYDAQYCAAGQRWRWDGVDLEILYPEGVGQRFGNNESCVLKVTAQGKSILFTGDIEKSGEKALIAMNGDKIASTVLIVPHHGSKTSSSPDFLEKVNPEIGVFSFGYRNRYKHPSPSVLERYRQKGIDRVDTVEGGAIEITLRERIEIKRYRDVNKHFWHF